MTHLYAEKNNITPREAVGRTELRNYIDYILRFHFGAESGQSNLSQIHGAAEAGFGLNFKAQRNVDEQFGGLLGATMFCVHLANACLSLASEGAASSQTAAELYGGAMRSLDGTAKCPDGGSTIHHLGKRDYSFVYTSTLYDKTHLTSHCVL